MSQQHLTRLRGFQDWIGPSAEALSLVEKTFSSIAQRHGFHEIRIPTVERVELYARSSGDTSDIVEKQMYTFSDHDEAATTIALRPEGTPGVVRAYIEAGLDRSDPEQRLYYSGAMFRRERPQKGRYRQFYQFGVEVFGRADAACDAEVILMIDELQRELGVEFRFEINSIGDGQCRPQFRDAVYQLGQGRTTTSSATTAKIGWSAIRCVCSIAKPMSRWSSMRPRAPTIYAIRARRISLR